MASLTKYNSCFSRSRITKLNIPINRDKHSKGKSRVGDGKDVAHTKRGLVLKKESANRGSKTDSPGDRRARGCKK